MVSPSSRSVTGIDSPQASYASLHRWRSSYGRSVRSRPVSRMCSGPDALCLDSRTRMGKAQRFSRMWSWLAVGGLGDLKSQQCHQAALTAPVMRADLAPGGKGAGGRSALFGEGDQLLHQPAPQGRAIRVPPVPASSPAVQAGQDRSPSSARSQCRGVAGTWPGHWALRAGVPSHQQRRLGGPPRFISWPQRVSIAKRFRPAGPG
jgi:hypothetical protein